MTLKQRSSTVIAGVVLAAGDSQRFSEPKQLLLWRGKPLVWYSVRAALEGGLHPVVVVTGAGEAAVKKALRGEPVEFVHNQDWKSGQSSSMKVGLSVVSEEAEAVVMLLADMPMVDAALVHALVTAHGETDAVIVAPRVGEQRGNPVLFTRSTYSDLIAIEGDRGGRALIGVLPTMWVDWDESILHDVDNREDWKRLRGEE